MYNHYQGKTLDTTTYIGMYRGEVVSNKDPLVSGRCKIRVMSVYDDLSDKDIPWALYADPFMGGSVDVGGFFIPDEGSHVWCFFEAGNHELPVYFAGAPAKPHMPSEKNATTYPENRVFKTKTGHVIEIDDSPGAERIRVKHMSGTQYEFVHDGSVIETITGNLTRIITGNVTETVEGEFTSNTTGAVTLSSGGTFTTNSGSGSTVLTSTYEINGQTYETHKHNQDPDSGGDTQVKTSTPVV